MPLAILIVVIAWFISNGIYRAIVGTKCAFKGIDPPWIAARQEKLTNREIRRGRRREVLDSKRTARGFIARLWGDLWEDLDKFVEELRNPTDPGLGELGTPDAPGVKPVEIVPGDAGASWVRTLGGKATAASHWVQDLWDKWFSRSQNHCVWRLLEEDRPCGKKAAAAKRYCRQHERLAAEGHCLWGHNNDDVPPCMSHREGDFPFCTGHMDEWERRVAATVTVEPATLGTLDTPDIPGLAATPEICRKSVDDGAGFGRPCGRPVPVGATTPDCGQHGDSVVPGLTASGHRRCWWGFTQFKGNPDFGHPHCPAAVEDAASTLCESHADQHEAWVAEQRRIREQQQAAAVPPSAKATEPTCQWGHGATTESPDYRATPCTEDADLPTLYCPEHRNAMNRWVQELRAKAATATPPPPTPYGVPLPAETEEDRQRRLAAAEAERPHCPAPINAAGAVCGMPMHRSLTGWICTLPHAPVQDSAPPAEPNAATPSAADAEAPPQRPVLRVVPNTDTTTQGDTNTMTTPTQQPTGAMTTTQGLADYAASLRNYGTVEWPANIQDGLQQVTNAGLANDPEIASCFGELTQISATVAAVADKIDAALANGHNSTTEAVTGLGDRAGNIDAYRRN